MSRRRLSPLQRLRRKVRFKRWAAVVLFAMGVLAGISVTLALVVPGCESQPKAIPATKGRLASIQGEPLVRVRIRRSAATVELAAPSGLTVSAGAGETMQFNGPVRIFHDGSRFLITQVKTGEQGAWAAAMVRCYAASGGEAATVRVDGNAYPQVIAIHPGAQQGTIDVINHVPMEQYIPGVLSKELFAHWEFEAFRAQSIAARSYAIHHLRFSQGRHFDLESTEASQAYIGVASHSKATEAVRQTRGIVLAYDDDVLPAYYSSCTGGTGQDAAAIFPNQPDVPPLRGTQQGDWGKESPQFRWTLRLDRATLSKRIAAWGKANGYTIAALQLIGDIKVTATNSVGRPTQITVTDANGRAFPLKAEPFRWACNYNAPGLPEVDGKSMVRSSHVAVTVTASDVLINGAGYGHGVGLCQYSIQAMAKAGYAAPGMLQFFYPGAELRQVY